MGWSLTPDSCGIKTLPLDGTGGYCVTNDAVSVSAGLGCESAVSAARSHISMAELAQFALAILHPSKYASKENGTRER